MQLKYRGIIGGLLAASVAGILLTGCSRSTINSQVAEAIGTTGMYENGEPVESPRMKLEREQREQEESEQAWFEEQLAAAQELADGYYYEEAVSYLENLDVTSDAISAAIETYQSEMSSIVKYDGSIVHLCFPTLVEDSLRAFDGDDLSETYKRNLITTGEFRAILENLYERGYVLIDMHSIAGEDTDDRGITTMEAKDLYLPSGKKPLIISQDNLNYSEVKNGNGIATRLVLDDGEVKALYTDDGGHDLKGDYDLIPILNSFVEEHPDFSYRGAKGIVSVSGSQGVFGYNIGNAEDSDNLSDIETANRETVTQISNILKSEGWQIASAGYTHSYMNAMTLSELTEELQNWQLNVGTLVGKPDILFYPYGAEITDKDQLETLVSSGLVYLCGLWSDQDFIAVEESYLRQTRRFIDGYSLMYASDYFIDFFDASELLDEYRS